MTEMSSHLNAYLIVSAFSAYFLAENVNQLAVSGNFGNSLLECMATAQPQLLPPWTVLILLLKSIQERYRLRTRLEENLVWAQVQIIDKKQLLTSISHPPVTGSMERDDIDDQDYFLIKTRLRLEITLQYFMLKRGCPFPNNIFHQMFNIKKVNVEIVHEIDVESHQT